MQTQGVARPNENDIPTALIYIHVAADDRAMEGLSLPSQLDDCRRTVADRGWALGGEYQDVLAGRRDDRPGYQQLLAEARRLRAEGGAVVVLCKALDRLGRTVAERVRAVDELRTAGSEVFSVTDGGFVSDLIRNVLAAVAGEEAGRLAGQVSEARRQIAGAGWYLPGQPPWGYRWRKATAEERAMGAPQKVLEEDPQTATFVREAYRRAAADEAIQSVARWVQSLPETARGGRRMSYQAVRFILHSPTYVGLRSSELDDAGRQKLSGSLSTERGRWPSLVDAETWSRVQELTAKHRDLPPRQASGRHLLTGFIRCPRCGSRMVGIDRQKGEQRKAPGYQCRGAHYYGAAAPDPTCHFRAVKPPVDAALVEKACHVLDSATTMDPTLRSALQTAWHGLRGQESASAIAAQISQLEREAERYRYRLGEGARMLVDGVLDRAGYERLREAQEANLESAESELERLETARPKRTLPPLEEVVASAGGWAEALRSGEVKEQREVLSLLVDRVVPVRLGGGQYDVEITWTPLGSALARLAEYRDRTGSG
jgi:DNA invertase Pin-like site-specific DNA recombinase